MGRRKTLKSLDQSLLMTAAASLIAVASMGVVVHGIMWARVQGETASEKTPEPRPRAPVRISSKTLAA